MWILGVLLALPAQAEDCEASTLAKVLREAGPSESAVAFSELADCDAALAKREAKNAFGDMNPTDEGYKALVKAVQIGVMEPAVGWVDQLQSDTRSYAIAALGKACANSEPVQQFFLDRAESLGDEFWDQRWYKGLSQCRSDSNSELLWSRLSAGVGRDYALFYGVLEAYTRSTGEAAIPNIGALLKDSKDGEVQSQLVASLFDAVQTAGDGQVIPKIADPAIEAIVSVSELLDTKALNQARQTLLQLDAERQSDELAAVVHKDMIQSDGSFLWATVVLETANCKNGKVMQRVQTASVKEGGNTWGDQAQGKVKEAVEVGWILDLAERCKGTGDIQFHVSETPLKGKSEIKDWIDAKVKELRLEDAKKFVEMDHPQIVI